MPKHKILALLAVATVLPASSAQQPSSGEPALLRLRIDGRLDMRLGESTRQELHSNCLDYRLWGSPNARRVQVDRLTRLSTVDGELQVFSDARRERLHDYRDGQDDWILRVGAEDQMARYLAGFGVPTWRVEVDDGGAETGREPLVDPPADEALLDTALLFHAPFPPDRSTWRSLRRLAGTLDASGELVYRRAGEDRADGLVAVDVEGVMIGTRQVADHTLTNTLRLAGRQLYDPQRAAWVSGRLSGPVLVESHDAAGAVDRGSGEITVALEHWSDDWGWFEDRHIIDDVVSYERPASWRDAGAAPMRVLNFTLGDGAECSLSVLAGDGGGVRANLERWARQVGAEAPAADMERQLPRLMVLSRVALLVRFDGDERAMLGMICPYDGSTIYARLTGPNDVVTAARSDFERFCGSFVVGGIPKLTVRVVNEDSEASALEDAADVARIDDLFARYQRAAKAGDLETAAPLLAEINEQVGGTAKSWGMLGTMRSRLGEFEPAVEALDRALDLDPTLAEAWYERAFARFRLGDMKAALGDYDRALGLAPENSNAWGERGDVLSELGRHEESRDSYTRAIELNPDWMNAHSGRASQRLVMGDYAGARADLERASELVQDPDPLWLQGLLMTAAFLDSPSATTLAGFAELAAAAPHTRIGSDYAEFSWLVGEREACDRMLRQRSESAPADVAAMAGLQRSGLALVRARPADVEPLDVDTVPTSLRPWALLLRWCEESLAGDLDAATERLREASGGFEEEEAARRAFDACLGAAPVRDAKPYQMCAAYLLAGWRADRLGNAAAATRWYSRCVNTGATNWLQWKMAQVLLEQRLAQAPLAIATGLQLEFEDVDGRSEARITVLAPGGAAEEQELQVGDVIVELLGQPITREAWATATTEGFVGRALPLRTRRDGGLRRGVLCLGVPVSR